MNGEYITPFENVPDTPSQEKKTRAKENVAQGLDLLRQHPLDQHSATSCDMEGEIPSPIEKPKDPLEPPTPVDPSEGKENRIIPDDGTPYIPPEEKIQEP